MAWMEGMDGDFGVGGLDSGLRRNDGRGAGIPVMGSERRMGVIMLMDRICGGRLPSMYGTPYNTASGPV